MGRPAVKGGGGDVVHDGGRTLGIGVGMAAVGVITGVALAVSRHLPGGPLVSPLGCFGGAVVTSLGAFHLSSQGRIGVRAGWVVALGSLLVLGIVAWLGARHPAVGIAVDMALLGVTFVVGSGIGWRIEDAGHLLPAAVVAAAADIASVLSPEGPSHAIAASERALSIAAFSFPVPGFFEMGPAIGAGDLTMVALFLATARKHGISAGRVTLLALAGALVSGVIAAALERPIPALPAIGAMIVLGVPETRKIRRKDRNVTLVAMALAIGVAIAVAIRARYFS